MYRALLLFLIVSSAYTATASAQQPRLATYQEIASVIVDQRLSNNVTASVTLQTTSTQEFQIPEELEQKILNQTDIVAVILTNEDQCVLGVKDQICIMINSKRIEGEGGIKAAQMRARQLGDLLIEDVNSALSFDAKFHSVFIHYDDKANRALDTSGEISGAGTVSAVYTAQMESTDFMFNKISATLIPRQIRAYGGFFDMAQNLSKDDASRMTFTITPKPEGLIMQIKVSKDYPNAADGITRIDPQEFLKAEQIRKSDYFDAGFFPLNSLIHVVIVPQNNLTKAHVTSTIPSMEKNGEIIPSDLTKSGWFFTSETPSRIEAVYLFGESDFADADQIIMTLSGQEWKGASDAAVMDEIYILIGIGIAAAGAAAYYLKGIKRKA